MRTFSCLEFIPEGSREAEVDLGTKETHGTGLVPLRADSQIRTAMCESCFSAVVWNGPSTQRNDEEGSPIHLVIFCATSEGKTSLEALLVAFKVSSLSSCR